MSSEERPQTTVGPALTAAGASEMTQGDDDVVTSLLRIAPCSGANLPLSQIGDMQSDGLPHTPRLAGTDKQVVNDDLTYASAFVTTIDAAPAPSGSAANMSVERTQDELDRAITELESVSGAIRKVFGHDSDPARSPRSHLLGAKSILLAEDPANPRQQEPSNVDISPDESKPSMEHGNISTSCILGGGPILKIVVTSPTGEVELESECCAWKTTTGFDDAVESPVLKTDIRQSASLVDSRNAFISLTPAQPDAYNESMSPDSTTGTAKILANSSTFEHDHVSALPTAQPPALLDSSELTCAVSHSVDSVAPSDESALPATGNPASLPGFLLSLGNFTTSLAPPGTVLAQGDRTRTETTHQEPATSFDSFPSTAISLSAGSGLPPTSILQDNERLPRPVGPEFTTPIISSPDSPDSQALNSSSGCPAKDQPTDLKGSAASIVQEGDRREQNAKKLVDRQSEVLTVPVAAVAPADISSMEYDRGDISSLLDEDPPSQVLTLSGLPCPQMSADILPRMGPDTIDELDNNALPLAKSPGKETFVDDDMDLDDTLPPSSPILMSSQPRASSPDAIFSSSPPGLFESPPTSPHLMPAIDEKEEITRVNEIELDVTQNSKRLSIALGKREMDSELLATEEICRKRKKREDTLTLLTPPNPKRPTPASQKKQYRKLIKPFRSPLENYQDVLAGKDAVYASGHAQSQISSTSSFNKVGSSAEQPTITQEAPVQAIPVPTATRDRTAQAAKPFRSPFSMPTSVSTSGAPSTSGFTASFPSVSRVQAAPTIQSLQARVQKLRQAIKIKEERGGADDTCKLETLVTKWRSAGREIAWLVWDTVKDLETGTAPGILPAKGGWDEGENPYAGSQAKDTSRGWGYDRRKDGNSWSGWGWDEKGSDRGEAADIESGGAEMSDVDADGDQPEAPAHTVGTMLRHMGIDPETLGWNEEEGDFVGDA